MTARATVYWQWNYQKSNREERQTKPDAFSTDGSANMPLNLADQQQSAGGKQIGFDGYQQSVITAYFWHRSTV